MCGCFLRAGLTSWISSGFGGTNGPCSSVPVMIRGSLCGLQPPGSAAAAGDGGEAPVASSADGFASSAVDILYCWPRYALAVSLPPMRLAWRKWQKNRGRKGANFCPQGSLCPLLCMRHSEPKDLADFFCKRSHLHARSTHARCLSPSDSDSDR